MRLQDEIAVAKEIYVERMLPSQQTCFGSLPGKRSLIPHWGAAAALARFRVAT